MNNRAGSLGLMMTLGVVAACSVSSSQETVGTDEQATTKCLPDDCDPPPCTGTGCVKSNTCTGSLPAGEQCGTYLRTCTLTGSTEVTVGCPDYEVCGGGPVPGAGTAHVCGDVFPPGCAATGTGDNGCTGTCDNDPATNQPFACELTPSIFELLAPTPSGPLMDVTATHSSGTALPCTVWDFDEWDSTSGYHNYVAYCLNSTSTGPTGTVMGDWASAVNTAYPTTVGPQTINGTIVQSVEQTNGESCTDVPRGVPYDAQLTTQPRTLAAEASGYVYVEFRANPLPPPTFCVWNGHSWTCDQGCTGTNEDTQCIIQNPIPLPLPIQVQPTPPPFGERVAGGF